jgi:DNA-binding NarL/FixJ family response regulator
MGLVMPNILIVDDFAPIRTSLRQYFEARGLGTCFEASDGVEALRLAKHVKPNVVILDYAMPIMDGATAAKVFHEKMPDVPILMFTAHGTIAQRMLSNVHLFGIFSKDNITSLIEAVVKCLRATAIHRSFETEAETPEP